MKQLFDASHLVCGRRGCCIVSSKLSTESKYIERHAGLWICSYNAATTQVQQEKLFNHDKCTYHDVHTITNKQISIHPTFAASIGGSVVTTTSRMNHAALCWSIRCCPSPRAWLWVGAVIPRCLSAGVTLIRSRHRDLRSSYSLSCCTCVCRSALQAQNESTKLHVAAPAMANATASDLGTRSILKKVQQSQTAQTKKRVRFNARAVERLVNVFGESTPTNRFTSKVSAAGSLSLKRPQIAHCSLDSVALSKIHSNTCDNI